MSKFFQISLPNLLITLTNDLFYWQLIPLDVPNTTDSYYAYMQRAIVADIKESVCRVPDSAFDGAVPHSGSLGSRLQTCRITCCLRS